MDKTLAEYRLFVLGAQTGIPVRHGVRHETPFVGPGMRDLATLDYLPARLSLMPRILATAHTPDIVLLPIPTTASSNCPTRSREERTAAKRT